jgi:hypothetical protein
MNSERTSINIKMNLRRLKKEMHEKLKTAQGMKEEFNKDMETH